jgi:hypothetical protein
MKYKAGSTAALIIFAVSLVTVPQYSGAKQARSGIAVRAFQRENPCPANGDRRGACPGYVIDHVIPVCAGGPDEPANMQWQTIVDARQKDKGEIRECALLRREMKKSQALFDD